MPALLRLQPSACNLARASIGHNPVRQGAPGLRISAAAAVPPAFAGNGDTRLAVLAGASEVGLPLSALNLPHGRPAAKTGRWNAMASASPLARPIDCGVDCRQLQRATSVLVQGAPWLSLPANEPSCAGFRMVGQRASPVRGSPRQRALPHPDR